LIIHHAVLGHVVIKSQLGAIDQIVLHRDLTTYISSATQCENKTFLLSQNNWLKILKNLTLLIQSFVVSVDVHSPRQDVPNGWVILRPVITLLGSNAPKTLESTPRHITTW